MYVRVRGNDILKQGQIYRQNPNKILLRTENILLKVPTNVKRPIVFSVSWHFLVQYISLLLSICRYFSIYEGG